jgi:epoxyqueuosine reductase QueG
VEGGPFVFASTWSERHAAHAAGLGTFGLCDGLITPLGKSIRVGTVVARAPWPANPRPYKGHRDWCLFFATGKCGACIKRCPAGALSPAGHDKRKCKAYIRGVTSPYVEAKLLGVPVNACGLCQTGVPCERGIPAALQKRAKA